MFEERISEKTASGPSGDITKYNP